MIAVTRRHQALRRLRGARRRRRSRSPTGSLTALLGPSGSGKSTLLRIIAGLEAPDAGHASRSTATTRRGVPPQKRGIGFVFQHYAAFKHMTVRDNVAFGLEDPQAPEGGDRRARRRAARRSSGSPATRTATRRSSPAASASAWRSPARSRSSRACCCSTSRSARWTRRSARSCASGCGACTTRSTSRRVLVTHDQEEAMVGRRPHRGHGPRAHRAGRRAARALRAAGERVRHGLPRAGQPSSASRSCARTTSRSSLEPGRGRARGAGHPRRAPRLRGPRRARAARRRARSPCSSRATRPSSSSSRRRHRVAAGPRGASRVSA